MTSNNKLNASRTYQAPVCDACEYLAGNLVCQSGSTEDWVVDEYGF